MTKKLVALKPWNSLFAPFSTYIYSCLDLLEIEFDVPSYAVGCAKKVGGGEVSGVHWQLASLLETSIKMTEVGWEELKEEPLSAHQRRTFGAGVSMTTIL